MNREEKLVSRFAPLLILLAGACWGVIGIFTMNLTADGYSAAQITFVRCGISAVMLWLFLLIFDRQKLKIRLRDIWIFLGTGILSLVFFSVMYFMTQQSATLSVAAVLLYTAPCFVMIMSAIFFKEKITARKIFSLVLAFAGCMFTTGLVESMITGSTGSVPAATILTGIASGVGYALYSIFGNVALKRYSSITVTAYTMLIAAAALAPFCAVNELLPAITVGSTLRYAIGIATVSTILPYLLYTLGLKYTEPGKASVMAFSEPVVATLTGIIAFRERMTVGGIIGIALIFVSIVILNTSCKKRMSSENYKNNFKKTN